MVNDEGTYMSTKTSSAVTTVTTVTTAREAIKAHEDQQKKAEARLRELLGDAQVGMIRGVERFKLQNSHNTSVDRAKLQAGWPEAFEATLKKTPYDFIKAL